MYLDFKKIREFEYKIGFEVLINKNIESGSGVVEKELANWIYYEDGHTFYCYDCCQKRVKEINVNKEFSEDINYEGGDECGYMQDYAFQDYEVECEKCSKPLFSEVDF